MKCKQKLCQRSKNIKSNGDCSVCSDAIEAAIKKDARPRTRTNKNVKMDMNLMVEIHNKLSKGLPVDSNEVSRLMLGGVINIINQHDTIEELEIKVEGAKMENHTNNVRMEMLETWVQKQDELIKELDAKLTSFDRNGVILKENKETKDIQKKICSLELELSRSKSIHRINRNLDQIESKHKGPKCNMCEERFSLNCDLEKHLEEKHNAAKEHS
jgi:hypothetical protein